MPSTESPAEHRTAVITVSYGSGDALAIFLQSLSEFEKPLSVVVVDNKPDEDNVRDLTERFNALYVPLPQNPGYGAGMNAGVRALGAADTARTFDAYFFCNPDLRLIEPVVDRLADSLRDDPLAGSIGPRLLNEDGSTYPSARNIPSIGTGIGHALLSKLWPQNPWTRAYQNASDYDARRSAGSLSGAAVMTKAEVYDSIGGWDEAYFMHFEDIDLGWRIGKAGYLNIYEPAVSVEHSGAHSTKKHAVLVERAMTQSAIHFMSKRYAGFWNAPIRWGVNTGLRLRGWLKVRAASRG